MTGVHLNLISGILTRGESEARAACGIDGNRPLVSSKWLGRTETAFGLVDHLQMMDADHIRTYDVAPNGALVAATIADLDGTIRLKNWATALLPALPEEDMFSETSLGRSVAPEPMVTDASAADLTIALRK
jgi:hypothetical protein